MASDRVFKTAPSGVFLFFGLGWLVWVVIGGHVQIRVDTDLCVGIQSTE